MSAVEPRTGFGGRRPRVILAVCAVLLSTTRHAFALNPALDVSQYAHTAWRIRDGFAKGAIDAIAQTPDGYLWLGTEFGLLRFDGVRNVQWQPPAGDGLPSAWVRALLVGRDGTLWIGTLKGLVSWKDGRLTQYPGLAGMSIDALVEDRQGTLWAGGVDVPNGILCAIEIRAKAVQCYGEDGIFGGYTGSLFEDGLGNLWVGALNGLWRWKAGSPTRYAGLENPNIAVAFLEGAGHELLIASGAGLRRLVDGRLERYAVPGKGDLRSTRLLRDRDGGLWIGTYTAGLVHVRGNRADAFTHIDGLSSDDVVGLFEDREGSVWVVTSDGLDRFRELAVPTISVKQGLSSDLVTTVTAATDGGVWLGTPNGLDYWNDGRIEHYRDVHPVPFVFQADRGRLWVSTDQRFGFFENGRFVPLGGVPGGIVRSMTVDRRGDIWIAHQHRGLFRVQRESEVSALPWDDLGREGFASAIAADRSRDGVWIGFYKGGVAYFADGHIRARYGAADGVGNGVVSYLRAEADGTVWAATEGGLSRLKDKRIATLTTRNGLPCDNVLWMMEGDAHSYWLSTTCGLVRIARADLDAWALASDTNQKADGTVNIRVFDTFDGVRSHAAVPGRPPVAKSSDGKLWFLPFDGVSVVDPQHLPLNNVPPPVHIEQIVADRRNYDAMAVANGVVRLPPLTRDLQIDYTALSFVAPEKMQFRYKLEGWDGDWQAVGTRRQAFYQSLRPGRYRFRVIAANNSGMWNEAGAAIDLSVAPAYYQTPWFLALAAGMVVALAWAVHRVRLRIVEKHEREISALNERLMKAQEQERIRIAGELHDGVMQQMLAATMMLGTAKHRIADNADARATIDKVQERLIQAGTDIRQLSHGLHPPILQEAGLPNAVRAYCEQFSGTCGIPISCEADEDGRDLSRGAALALFRIVQEALGNAAKHAHARRIAVRLTRSAGVVSVTVSDDGVGFDASRLGTSGGLGLIMMRERASQLNGTFEFESGRGRGTTIRVAIPFR